MPVQNSPGLLADIRNFSKTRLRNVDMKITTPDGKQLVQRGASSQPREIVKKEAPSQPSQQIYGFVPDTTPDLEIAECIPGALYLGSQDVAASLDHLKSRGVSHVLNCTGRGGVRNFFPQMVRYKTLELLDTPQQSLSRAIPEATAYIDIVRQQGGTVLVHCNAGLSRAPTIVIAYLMAREGLSFDEAFSRCRAVRPHTRPNDGFMRQLRDFGQQLDMQRSQAPVSDF